MGWHAGVRTRSSPLRHPSLIEILTLGGRRGLTSVRLPYCNLHWVNQSLDFAAFTSRYIKITMRLTLKNTNIVFIRCFDIYLCVSFRCMLLYDFSIVVLFIIFVSLFGTVFLLNESSNQKACFICVHGCCLRELA